MSSVDDRIVNMQFNNKQFTEGVTQSQRSLDSLEKTIANTAKSKGLQGMESSVNSVTQKFSAMKVAGIAAVATIASKMTMMGMNLLKSFTIQPIMDGFREYQTGLDSIQTIMANTGKSVKTVNNALDQLNHYSDQTIYNFGQMAKNVGTFTAAGVDLKTSVASIKGIANLAALSGSNSQQASTAMYQLSQAIASGRVGLQDWNSVVNAGMGGKIFQTALARTAQNMGTLGGNAVKMVGPMKKLTVAGTSFRESISAKGDKQWLTSEVLVETLKQISGGYDLAALKAEGYSTAQAKAILDLQRRAFDAATQIKTLPQLIGVIQESIGSTWSGVFRTVMGDFKQSKKLWSDVGYAIIGPNGFLTKAQNGLENFVKEWAKAGGRSKAIDAFKTGFKSIGAVLSQLGKAWNDVFPESKSNWMLELTKSLQSLTHALIPTGDTLDNLRSIFGGVFAILHTGLSVVSAVKNLFMGLLKGIFENSGAASGGILSILASIGEVLKGFDKWATAGGKLSDVMTKAGNVAGVFVAPLVAGIGLIIKGLAALASGQGIEGFMKQFDQAKVMFDTFGEAVSSAFSKLSGPLKTVSDFFGDLRDKLSGLKGTFAGVADMAGRISDNLSALADRFRGVNEASAKTGDTISSSVEKVRGVTDSAKKSVEGMYASFTGASASAATTSTQTLASAGESTKSAWETVKGIFSALGDAIGSVFSHIGDAAGFVKKQFSDLFGSYDAIGWASVINAMFTGSLLFTLKNFMGDLKDMFGQWGDLGKAIGGTFGQLTDTLKTMQQQVKAKMIMFIAIAVGILTAALIALSFVDVPSLAISLGAITIMLGLLVGSLYALGKVQSEMNMALIATSILLISVAMLNLATAITILGQQDPLKVATGLGFMAASLGVLMGAMFGFTKIKGSIEGFAGSLMVMSLAMLALSAAVLSFGSMDMETLKQGLGGMGIGMGILVGAMLLLSKTAVGVEKTAPAIYVMAAAMTMLSLAVRSFGSMDFDTLKQGLGAVAIGIGIMVGALLILSNFGGQATVAAGSVLIMALALNMLMTVVLGLGAAPWEDVSQGLKAMAIALGILLAAGALAYFVAPGLAILALTIGVLGAAMLMAGVGMLAFGTGFALMAAAGVAGVAIITAAFHVFLAMLPSLAIQLAAALVSFLQTLAAMAPKIRKAVGVIFRNMIGVIQDNIPVIRKLIQTLIDNGIQVIEDTIPRWIEMGWTIIDRFLNSAEKHVPQIADSAMSLVTKFMDTIANRFPKLADSAAKMIIAFIQGTADAINNNVDDLRNAGIDLAHAIVNGMTGGLLDEGIDAIRNAVSRLTEHIPQRIRELLGIASPSKVTRKLGHNVAEGLALGITDKIRNAVKAVTEMANAVIAEGNKAVAKAQGLASKAQKKAYDASEKYRITSKRAKEARAYADKHPKNKQAEKDAKELERQAEREKRTADKRQKAADRAAQHVQDVQTFEKADLHGKGDIRNQEAVILADRANQMLSRANAEAARARELMETNRKAGRAMLAQAKRDADAAKKLADKAKKAHKKANEYYGKEVDARIKQIEDDRKAEEDAKAAQAELDAADAQGKADILTKRAEADEAKAQAAREQAQALLDQAKALGDKDAAKAMELLDQSEAAAKEAADAAEKAKQEREDAARALEQDAPSSPPGSGGTTGTGSSIQPSRSILEDAASAVDRYTASLQQASELAASQQGVIQFVQHNTSPEALTASEIYRQSKNLLSAAEIKMGANS